MFFFFFFKAEAGIRDSSVTGVQTCALPISRREASAPARKAPAASTRAAPSPSPPRRQAGQTLSGDCPASPPHIALSRCPSVPAPSAATPPPARTRRTSTPPPSFHLCPPPPPPPLSSTPPPPPRP